MTINNKEKYANFLFLFLNELKKRREKGGAEEHGTYWNKRQFQDEADRKEISWQGKKLQEVMSKYMKQIDNEPRGKVKTNFKCSAVNEYRESLEVSRNIGESKE